MFLTDGEKPSSSPSSRLEVIRQISQANVFSKSTHNSMLSNKLHQSVCFFNFDKR